MTGIAKDRLPAESEKKRVELEIDTRAIRGSLGLTQRDFAARFRLIRRSPADWERGRYKPSGVASTLLTVIERDPQLVERVLNRTSTADVCWGLSSPKSP